MAKCVLGMHWNLGLMYNSPPLPQLKEENCDPTFSYQGYVSSRCYFYFLFETRSHYVAWDCLDLTMFISLALNSQSYKVL